MSSDFEFCDDFYKRLDVPPILPDTVQIVTDFSKILFDLIDILRKRGFDIPQNATLCEIVELLKKNNILYCGFVRCTEGKDAIHFFDDAYIYKTGTLFYESWEKPIFIKDFVKVEKNISINPKVSERLFVKDFFGKPRKLDPFTPNIPIEGLGYLIDLQPRIYLQRVGGEGTTINEAYWERPLFVEDAIKWQLYTVKWISSNLLSIPGNTLGNIIQNSNGNNITIVVNGTSEFLREILNSENEVIGTNYIDIADLFIKSGS
jgi:hypothetical protein